MKHEIAQAIIQSANRGNLCLRDKFVLRKKTSTSRNLAANTEHPAAIAVEDAETGGGCSYNPTLFVFHITSRGRNLY